MLSDFNETEYLKKIQIRQKQIQQLDDITAQIEQIKEVIKEKNSQKFTLQNEINSLFADKKNTFVSRILNMLHIGKAHKIDIAIRVKQELLKSLEEECEQIVAKRDELATVKKQLEKSIETEQIPLKTIDNNLVITDKKLTTYPEPSNNLVLVHCTNFFPINNTILSNYDGNDIGSIEIEYNGVVKKITALSHRHEVHFTINNIVHSTGDGRGNWDSPTYIIIDNYEPHEQEIENVSNSDSWTKGTSLKLTKDAVILMKIEDKDKLPKEELEKYHIVYYEGNPQVCLTNFLKLNGYPILKTDSNDASHEHSLRIIQERGTQNRDLAINFIRNTPYLEKQPLEFTMEELVQIIDIMLQFPIRFRISFENLKTQKIEICGQEVKNENKDIYIKLIKTIIISGIRKGADNKYSFEDDNVIFENIRAVAADNLNLQKYINLANEIFPWYYKFIRERKQKPTPSFTEISEMTIDQLYKFENQIACEAFQKMVSDNTLMIYDNGHLVIQIYMDKNYVMPQEFYYNDALNCFENSYDATLKVKDILKILDQITINKDIQEKTI